MQEENVEIVRRAWEASNRRPTPDFDTIRALYHSRHELSAVTDNLDGGTRAGAKGFDEWLEQMDATFETWDTRVERIEAIDAKRVLLVFVGMFQGRHSGASTEQQGAAVITLSDGLVTRTEVYTSLGQALEAAGLSE